MIIILGSRTDPHVDAVADVLKEKHNIEYAVVDYLGATEIAVHQDRQGLVELHLDGKAIRQPFLVWDRVKLLPGTELYLKGAEEDVGFAANEWRSFCRLLSRLAPLGAVNPLFSHTYLSKPLQQQIAANAGFLVPSTLVTNVKEAAVSFVEKNEDGTIMKSLSGAKIRPAGEGEQVPFIIMTMRVAKSDLAAAEEKELSFCPHFFQEEIKKDYELRVVYIAGKVFPFRINSQTYKSTEVDWRKGLWALEYTPIQLDVRTLKKINSFMHAADLFGGSIDLIVDKAGDVWFLECNQDGAWGWLNDLCEGGIAEAYADALVEQFLTRSQELRRVTSSENFVTL